MQIFKKRLEVFFRYKDLFFQLVGRDIKLKYRRSFLGYFWSVLNPLLMMVVMSIVFSSMFHRKIDNYPVYLVSGSILFNYMRDTTNRCLTSIKGNSSLLKKTYVPQYIFTLSRITSEFVNMLFSLPSLFIVMFATHVRISPYILLTVIPIAELYVFTVGLGLFLAQLSVFFRDTQHLWSVVCRAWMYLTPLFYEVEALPENIQWGVSHLNPMYYYIRAFRDYTWGGGPTRFKNLLYGGIIAVVMLIIGCVSFIKSKDKFILYI